MWVVPGSPLAVVQKEARLYRSQDHGLTWEPSLWVFTRNDDLMIPTICQFGRNYSGARDRFVYQYFIQPRNDKSDTIQRPGAVYLARCDGQRLLEREAYEFFTGMERGRAAWTKEITQKRPVFEDGEGTGWVTSASYNAGLKRYLLMTDHTASNRGNLGIFDAPAPWGPWTTVMYLDESQGTNFGAGRIEPNTFFWNAPTKWQSNDGLEFTLVFTGSGRGRDNDSFNLIRGRFGTGSRE